MNMKAFLYAMLIMIFAASGVTAAEFVVKGEKGAQVRVNLIPKECVKKKGKKLIILDACSSDVEVIVLTIGDPLELASGEHKFNLEEGIAAYTKAVGAPLYDVKAYGAVCAYLQSPQKMLCGEVGKSVQF